MAASDRRISELEADPAASQAELASAYVRKGDALYLAARAQEALSCYAEVVTRFGGADSPDVLVSVGWALIASALQFLDLFDVESAGRTLESLQARLGGLHDIRLHAQVLEARVVAAGMLVDENRANEGLRDLSEVVEEIGESPPAVFLQPLAQAMAAQARGLTEAGRYSEALTVCANMLNRFRGSENQEIKLKVAQVIRDRGLCLAAVGMHGAAIAAYTEVLELFSGIDYPIYRRFSADALFERSTAKLLLGDDEGALADLDRFVAEYWEVVSPTMQIGALRNRAAAYINIGRFKDALPIVERVLSDDETMHDPLMREVLARVTYYKGMILENLGRTKEARETYASVATGFTESDDPDVHALVDLANGQLSRL